MCSVEALDVVLFGGEIARQHNSFIQNGVNHVLLVRIDGVTIWLIDFLYGAVCGAWGRRCGACLFSSARDCLC
jgi:hypothetical protein